jgi:isocitrate/isopropylmalate dehydrogenase
MPEWLSEKHADAYLAQVAGRIRSVIEKLLAEGAILTRDLGGTATTRDVTNAICGALN